MKIIAAILFLTAIVAQAQTASEPTWNLDGTYTCAIGKVCRTPTKKEIDEHGLTGWTGALTISAPPNKCDYIGQLDEKTGLCDIVIQIRRTNGQDLPEWKCGSLDKVDDSWTMHCTWRNKPQS